MPFQGRKVGTLTRLFLLYLGTIKGEGEIKLDVKERGEFENTCSQSYGAVARGWVHVNTGMTGTWGGQARDLYYSVKTGFRPW